MLHQVQSILSLPPIDEKIAARRRAILRVFAFVWALGLIDMLSHTSRDQIIFNKYSIPFTIGLVVYIGCLAIWGLLIWKPQIIEAPRQVVRTIQSKPWLAIAILIAIIPFFLYILTTERFVELPIIQMMILSYLLIGSAILIFHNWGPERFAWQTMVAIFLGTVAIFEILAQLLLITGAMPADMQYNAGISVPNGRVFLREGETITHANTNRYGWYYRPFRLQSESQRIAIIGDGMVEALQVSTDEHFGVLLENQLADPNIEFLGMGASGFGPAQYFQAIQYANGSYLTDEIIVVINLGDDFANLLKSQDGRTRQVHLYYRPDDSGNGELEILGLDGLHRLEHFFGDPLGLGYTTWVKTLRTHVVLDDVLRALLGQPAFSHLAANMTVEQWDDRDLSQRGFIFIDDDPAAAEANIVAAAVLDQMVAYAAENDVDLKFVTIPAFSEQFYAQSSAQWSAEIDQFNLFLPEETLVEYAAANGIQLLPTGSYMQNSGMSPANIQTLFLRDGYGHLSPEGHQFMAQMIQACFYPTSSAPAECQ